MVPVGVDECVGSDTYLWLLRIWWSFFCRISVWSLRGDDIEVGGDGSDRVLGLKGGWMTSAYLFGAGASFVVVCLGILPDMFDII